MKENYDFSQGIKNPYINKLKKQITIRIDTETIDYFKAQAAKSGISYQNLINSYLKDCATKQRKPELVWQK